MKILLTGGAGFIGSHLAERLLSRGDQLAIVDDLNSFYDPEIKRANLNTIRSKRNFEFYHNDITNRAAMEAVFNEVKPDKVVHMAACAGVLPSLENPALYSHVNLTGTAHVLQLSNYHRVKNFLFASSSSVYGLNSKVPFTEDDPVDQPISPYAASKRAAELLCQTFHHNYGLRITCLRYFTVYGPRQRPEMAIHKFANLMVQRKMIPVFARGATSRDYTFIDDAIDGTVAALDADLDYEIINLGNNRAVQIMHLIALLEKALGLHAQLQEMPSQPGDVPTTCADITKAARILNYKPSVSIEAGIQKFVDWFQAGSEGKVTEFLPDR